MPDVGGKGGPKRSRCLVTSSPQTMWVMAAAWSVIESRTSPSSALWESSRASAPTSTAPSSACAVIRGSITPSKSTPATANDNANVRVSPYGWPNWSLGVWVCGGGGSGRWDNNSFSVLQNGRIYLLPRHVGEEYLKRFSRPSDLRSNDHYNSDDVDQRGASLRYPSYCF